MSTIPPPDAAQKPPIPAAAVPLLALASFGSGASLRTADPMLPLLSTEFDVSLGDASLVITVFSVAYGLAQLFFGPLGDRYGKYFVIACVSLASALTSALCALAPGFESLLVARLFAGVTAAAIIPLSMAWIGDVIPYQQRQPVLARFLIGQILGLSVGVLFGGFAADLDNWRLPFYLVAVIFLGVSVALFSLNRRLPEHARQVGLVKGLALRRMASEFLKVLANPWARRVLLTVFLEGAFLYAAFAFIASHMYRTFGLSLAAAGALIVLYGMGGFVFALASARMVRGLGEIGLVRWGGLLVTVSLAAIGIAPFWWWAIPACLVAGLGFYMLHNTPQINATQMAPERRGAAVSTFSSCFFLGQSVGVGVAGLLVEHVGTSIIMLAGACGVLAIALRFGAALKARAAEDLS